MEVITVGLSPNTEPDDVKEAVRVLCMPWKWYQSDARNQARDWFNKQYHVSNIVFFSSGRSALTALLTAFGVSEGDEVILQAFTCMVVPNAIRFTGATPIYADIDNTANIDPVSIETKITVRTKAIIVQHTFGTPADMDSIVKIAHTHHILVIEDCAHALGAVYKGKNVGTIGDGAVLSFGRDKIISSVFGGAAIVKDAHVVRKLRIIEQKAPSPSFFWIAQQLCHPIASSIIIPLYTSGVGKLLLVILQTLHILSFPVSKTELSGNKPTNYVMRYPNALAYLLVGQLRKLKRYMSVRQKVSDSYERQLKKLHISYLGNREKSARLRFGILTHQQEAILRHAKQQGVLLGNWYHNVVDPKGSDIARSGYTKGSCPKAELLAKSIVNLPTRITEQQAEVMVRILQTV